jgi:hypothetical protein
VIGQATFAEDRDWWMPHAMLAAFALLVAAILRILFLWSAPLHAWLALAGVGVAVLAAHAGWRAARCARVRRWRDAWLACAFAAGLGAMGGGMLLAARSHVGQGTVLLDAPLVQPGATR